MALTKNDLRQLKEVISTEITSQLSTQLAAQDVRFGVALAQQSQDIQRDIRDEMDARFLASKNRMEKKFESLRREFRHEIQAVIDILLTFVPERFEKFEHDMVRVKAHLGLA